MAVGLHGTPQGLLRNMGECVGIIDEDPSPCGNGCVAALGRGHLSYKECHIVADCLNAAILVWRQEHTFIHRFFAP